MMQFIVITMFLLSCWLLLAVKWCVALLFNYRFYNAYYDQIGNISCHICSSCNPIIYGVFNLKLRKEMAKVLGFDKGTKGAVMVETEVDHTSTDGGKSSVSVKSP